ncbi:hypothetical protein AX16_002468 [Volvariella volvacea WC 439]|nr:hypothetical protein AX16_002468 [Volvariella volvacea WC 439]
MVEPQNRQQIRLDGANGGALSEPRVWFITGTSSGFGRRLAQIALDRGDRVIATARSAESLEQFSIEYLSSLPKSQSSNLRTLQLDITEGEESIKAKAKIAHDFWGKIDVLVNNAAVGFPGLLEEGGSALLKRQFTTNVFGLMDVTTAILPYMRARNSGTVVTVGSRSAWKSELPAIGAYAASKAAVHALTETLALEYSLAGFNIRFMLVAPGSFRTEGMYSRPWSIDNPIADHDGVREKSMTRFNSIPGTEKGDPWKAMNLLADIVRGEGDAKDKPWPFYLILGEDAAQDVRVKTQKVLKDLDAWEDLTTKLSFEEGQ